MARGQLKRKAIPHGVGTPCHLVTNAFEIKNDMYKKMIPADIFAREMQLRSRARGANATPATQQSPKGKGDDPLLVERVERKERCLSPAADSSEQK